MSGNFRNVCLRVYVLDPSQYFTSRGLFWDAMLKLALLKLKLFTDIDMQHFCKKKKRIREGVAMCVKRAAIANNKFISD